jgi:hypothetical protein
MRLPRMTPRQWMIAVSTAGLVLGAQRLADRRRAIKGRAIKGSQPDLIAPLGKSGP